MSKDVNEKRSKAVVRRRRRSGRPAPVSTNVTVTFRHVAPTDALRLYADRKFANLGRFLKRPCDAHLILTVDKYRQRGEVTVKSGRLTVVAEEETKDLYSVIDLLCGNDGRQLKKHLAKVRAGKTRSPSTGEVLADAERS
ncbi:MAG TPA: ribosome-associated translation inhibitor RaiA [Candidatus Binataceae bacterium]